MNSSVELASRVETKPSANGEHGEHGATGLLGLTAFVALLALAGYATSASGILQSVPVESSDQQIMETLLQM